MTAALLQSSVLRLSPAGKLGLEPGWAEGLSAGAARERMAELQAAASSGTGHLLLELGARWVGMTLPAPLDFWRDLGALFMCRLCRLASDERSPRLPQPSAELLRLLEGAPPMIGGEYLDAAVLSSCWVALQEAVQAELETRGITLGELLREDAPSWHQVGRLHLHLAERPDAECPFAFLATFTEGLTPGRRPRHLPLGRMIRDHADRRDQEGLASLIEPVRRAATSSDLIDGLLASGDLFYPLSWTAQEAFAFLQQVPTLETAGVIVKLPDWWRARSRPVVQVRLGNQEPTGFGLDALVDFDVTLALDGEELTEEEMRELRRQGDGLVFLRGRWVEANAPRLESLLSQWDGLRALGAEGVSMRQAMRILAGAQIEGDTYRAYVDDEPAWCERVAGDWLRAQLEGFREGDDGCIEALEGTVDARFRPYQEEGVRWLVSLCNLELGACLADDMGLGKTLQVLSCLASRILSGHTRHLVVVPTTLLANWTSEIERFVPDAAVLVAHSMAMARQELKAIAREDIDEVDFVLTSYGHLKRLPWIHDIAWDTVVLDEAQAIKNPGTAITRAAKKLRSRCRIVMTGTPIENDLGDLWSIFDFINPGLLGNRKRFGEFAQRLASREEDRYRPLRRLVSPYILRRHKSDPGIVPDLPAKQEVRAYCGLSRLQATLYGDTIDMLQDTLRKADGIERRGLVLATMTRLQQICNHPSHWLRDGDFAPARSGKFQRLAEICTEIASRQERVLVFTRFREMTAPLEGFLATVFGREGLVLHGGTPTRRRGSLVDEFQAESGPPFFVLSLKAGGTGLNLTAANHVVHFDRWWNPAVESQATDRAYRIGQGRSVLVNKLVCRGTIEERVDALLADKAELARELLGQTEIGVGKVLTALPDDELLELVRLDMNSAMATG